MCHQGRDAMPGGALWIITVDGDQSDQRMAIMMLVPRGREQRLALGNRRIIVLPDQQAAERHFGIERTVRACGSQPANRLRDALRRADLRIESGERDLGFDVALFGERLESGLGVVERLGSRGLFASCQLWPALSMRNQNAGAAVYAVMATGQGRGT